MGVEFNAGLLDRSWIFFMIRRTEMPAQNRQFPAEYISNDGANQNAGFKLAVLRAGAKHEFIVKKHLSYEPTIVTDETRLNQSKMKYLNLQ